MKQTILGMILALAASTLEARAVDVVFDSGDPAHVVVPGQEGRVALVLSNKEDNRIDVTLEVEVESFDGTTAEARAALTVPPQRRLRWPLPKRLFGGLGIKWVRFRIIDNGQESELREASFAYMRPAGPTSERSGGFLFGIAYGAGPDNHALRAAERSSLCGVKIARGHPVWPRIQPKPDQWDWSSCDEIVEAHAKHGIETQLLLSGAPRWSWQNGGEGVPTVKAWTTFLRDLAKRYRGEVRFYELWNEPDIGFFRGTQQQYIELLKAGYAAIKQSDPSAQVTTGGFASWTHSQTKPGMTARVIDQCQDSYDLIAYHRHGEFAGFRDELQGILLPYCRSVLKRPKPLYFTETGMDTRFGQHFQARTLPKKIAFTWANGAVAYTWFNLHDMRAAEHPRQPGFTYGLYTKLERLDPSQSFSPENMDYDRAWPKAVYVSYNTLTSLLANKQFIQRYSLAPDQYAYVFSDEGEHVVLAWNEMTASGSPHMVLATDADRVERIDLMGNRRSRPVVDGRTLLPLSEEPAYLVLKGETPPRLEGRLIGPTSAITTIPGRRSRVEVQVWNPTQDPVTLEMQWHLADDLKSQEAGSRTQKLAPNEKATIGLEANVPRRPAPRFGRIYPCTLKYRFPSIGWSGEIAVPVTVGAVVLASGELPKAPTFQLHGPRQVVNLSEHDPHTVHLLWKGRRDLSADVRLAQVEDGVKVQVAVQDDTHHVSSDAQLTASDSVEILVHTPKHDGLWRVVVADVDGKPQATVVQVPQGHNASKVNVRVSTWGDAPWQHYAIILPESVVGLHNRADQESPRLNLRIHDNDGRGHKGWLQVAPGDTSAAADLWPVLLAKTDQP